MFGLKHWLQNWLEINYINFNVPKSTIFPHRVGIVIGRSVVMGDKCRISQGVTIGSKSRFNKKQPVLGDNVCVYTNAIILGGIRIGDNAVIGAGSIVLKDVPNNGFVVGVWK